MVGRDATVSYSPFDSAVGDQVVKVVSREGFSHTDRVAALHDAYTVTVVNFVRAVRFQEAVLKGGGLSTRRALAGRVQLMARTKDKRE